MTIKLDSRPCHIFNSNLKRTMELLISLLFLLAAGFVLMLILHKLNSDTIKWLREENDRLKTQTKLARRED